MARRRKLDAFAGAFDRSPEQWRELGAPAFVYDMDAAAQTYSVWGMPCWGGGNDPADPPTRFYYIGMMWMPYCLKPRYLYHVGAATAGEMALLANQESRWDTPDRCRWRLLRPDAEVPSWLAECCRSTGRTRRGA
jgi:hypothetical protein